MPTYDTSAERRVGTRQPENRTRQPENRTRQPENRVQQMVADVAKVNNWRDTYNPLRSLTMPTAVSYLEQAQSGAVADLMWLYETGIEPTDADLSCIIERSESALRDCEWQVEKISEETKGFDKFLADEEESYLRELYEGIDNLHDSIAFLSSHRFRGFAHVNPWVSQTDPLKIDTLHCIPQWNVARDGYSGDWYWNPDARNVTGKHLPKDRRLAPEEVIWLETRRPVNRIALVKFIRANVAEKDWDAFVEIYGIPGVFVIAPEGTDQKNMADFLEMAEKAAQQASGALPGGSQVVTTQEARSNQPFQPRLEWLQEQLVLAGTGGLLTVLAESGSGTLAGSVHEQAFRQIARSQARRISEAFQRQLDKPRLARAFPGRPVQAYFELKARQEKNVGDFVNHVALLGAQGYMIAPEQVAQETGYQVEYRAPAPPVAPGAAFRGRAEGAESASALDEAGTPAPLAAVQAIFTRLQAMAADPTVTDAELQAAVTRAAETLPELLPELTAAIARPMALDSALAAAQGAEEGGTPRMPDVSLTGPDVRAAASNHSATVCNRFAKGSGKFSQGRKTRK